MMMIQLDPKYGPIILEALEDLLYKLSLEQDQMKGGPLSKERKAITRKQTLAEEAQHQISVSAE